MALVGVVITVVWLFYPRPQLKQAQDRIDGGYHRGSSVGYGPN